MASGRSPAPPISICSRAQFSQTCPCFGACEECRSASPARLSYRSSSRLRRRARPRRNAALRERRLTQTKAAPVSRRRSLARNPAGSAGCHDLQPKTGHQVSRSTLAAQSLMNAGGSRPHRRHSPATPLPPLAATGPSTGTSSRPENPYKKAIESFNGGLRNCQEVHDPPRL